ncbi:MAG: cupin domain-containing protein [Anaerolineae bacterium]|jgi:mannose-6-phosphate isomerase-like protein (cupin superfamily)
MAYSRYTFREYTGYVVAPWLSGVTQEWVAIRHSASVPPWADRDVHLHTTAEEYYFVFQGELRLLVDGAVLTLKPHEALCVRPEVPHAVVGGAGPIEHLIIRTPGSDDRRTVGGVPAALPPADREAERAVQLDWGCRVPLTETRYQNCWLFGFGQARFRSDYVCLAYLDFPTDESVGADWRSHPHQLHLHRESWEYYTVLKGKKTLQIEDDLVEVTAGEILEVPPGVRHVARAICTRYRGFTLRVPRLDDKVVFGDLHTPVV